MRSKLVVCFAAFVATAGVGTVINASPAYAVTGLQYVTATSAYDSTSPKSIVAVCPTGTVAINGGAYITGAVGSATLRQILPAQLFGAYFVSVVAEEDADGYAGSWLVTAIAVCIPPPAGLSFVVTSVTDPSYVWATASCGTKYIIGSGYSVTPTSWAKAAGAEIDSRNRAYLSLELSQVPPVATPITGTALAVCANAPLPGLRWLHTSTPIDSNNGKSAVTKCPAGTQVVGVGGDLYWMRAHTVIDDFTINPSTNSVIVTGYEDQYGNPDAWAADAYALCAT